MVQTYLYLSILFSTDEISDRRRPKTKAHIKPSIFIPDTNLSARRIMMTFMTNRKRPRVTMVIGRVNIISNGLTIAFSTANTKAKIMAVMNEFIFTCGSSINARPYVTAAVISILIMNLIFFFEN